MLSHFPRQSGAPPRPPPAPTHSKHMHRTRTNPSALHSSHDNSPSSQLSSTNKHNNPFEQILRAQPANIYEFGARYFAELVEENAAALQAHHAMEMAGEGGGGGTSIFDMSNEELQAWPVLHYYFLLFQLNFILTSG